MNENAVALLLLATFLIACGMVLDYAGRKNK